MISASTVSHNDMILPICLSSELCVITCLKIVALQSFTDFTDCQSLSPRKHSPLPSVRMVPFLLLKIDLCFTLSLSSNSPHHDSFCLCQMTERFYPHPSPRQLFPPPTQIPSHLLFFCLYSPWSKLLILAPEWVFSSPTSQLLYKSYLGLFPAWFFTVNML